MDLDIVHLCKPVFLDNLCLFCTQVYLGCMLWRENIIVTKDSIYNPHKTYVFHRIAFHFPHMVVYRYRFLCDWRPHTWHFQHMVDQHTKAHKSKKQNCKFDLDDSHHGVYTQHQNTWHRDYPANQAHKYIELDAQQPCTLLCHHI